MLKRLLTLGVSAFVLLSALGCAPKTQTKTAIYFDTVVTLTAEGEIPSSAYRVCEKYEKMLSVTDSESELSRLNRDKKIVSRELAEILTKAKHYGKISSGEFDVTLYPVKKLWGFGVSERVPKSAELKKALSSVDYKNIEINGDEITLKNNAEIDLGGIAKGYIADRLAELYFKEGTAGIINLGGNIMLPKRRKKPYKIGIANPKKPEKALCYLQLFEGAVSTSGVYQRKFEKNGKTYHHILSSSTGKPIDNGILSVTVIADTALAADALSTAVFCLGKKEGIRLINSLESTEAVIITESGEITVSKGLEMTGDRLQVTVDKLQSDT